MNGEGSNAGTNLLVASQPLGAFLGRSGGRGRRRHCVPRIKRAGPQSKIYSSNGKKGGDPNNRLDMGTTSPSFLVAPAKLVPID